MAQRNINRELHRFRESSRHIWNTCFFEGERVSIDDGFRFDELQRAMFKTLVLQPLGLPLNLDYKIAPIDEIVVRPQDGEIVIMQTRDIQDQTHGVCWSAHEVVSGGSLTRLAFVSFFDWDEFASLDMALVQCFEPAHGRMLLINQWDCSFHLDK